MGKITRVLVICKDENLKEVISFCLEGWGYEVVLSKKFLPTLPEIKKEEADLVIVGFPKDVVKKSLSLCKELKDDYITKSLPLIVLIDKRQLRKHLLEVRHGVDDYLFKSPDPLDLRIRIEMALRRSQSSFYTNSLTNLESGRRIEDVLRERLYKNERFAFAHVDIDNFKTFNDKYGYIRGDKAIIQTAYMLYNVVKQHDHHKDFVGHIGGDDFVFITSPEKETKIASEFIAQFDRLIPFHYSFEDREKGFVRVKNRLGELIDAPLMSVSVAIVNNTNRNFASVAEVNDVVASLKSYLKKNRGSNFMIERRKSNKGKEQRSGEAKRKTPPLKFIGKDLVKQKRVMPLGELSVDRLGISRENLEAALDLHWRRGVKLGEALKEMGCITDFDLKKLLAHQQKIANSV